MITTYFQQPDYTSGRKNYIDTARGIGLVFLVFGHIIKGNSYLFNWIFSFHMPLFFFLSGMCVKEDALGSFPDYTRKRMKKRLLPYFIITIIGLAVCITIPSYRKVIFADGLWLQASHIFLYMTPQNLYIGQVWFLAALFWAEIYFYLWHKLCGKARLSLQLLSALFLVPVAGNLWRIQALVPVTGRIPFMMDVAVMGAFCYILGFLTSKYHIPERIKKRGWMLIPPLLLCSIFFGTWKNGYVNMCDLVYGNSIVFYLIAMLAGISTILLIAFYIPAPACITWCGRNSLPLFASHTFLIYLIREIIYLLTGTHYTMMADVPYSLAFIMTAIIILLFLPIGMLYQFCCNIKKAVSQQLMPLCIPAQSSRK